MPREDPVQHPVLVTAAMVAEVWKFMDEPQAAARELRRLSQEEAPLGGMIEAHLGLISRLMEAWGAPEKAREDGMRACQIHLAALWVAWRKGLLSRWERESGIQLDPGEET